MALISDTGNINDNGGAGSIIVAGGAGFLRLDAQTGVSLTSALNDVAEIAGQVEDNGASFAYTDANNLTIGTADGVNGLTANNGAIDVISNAGNLTVAQNVASGGGAIALSTSATASTTTVNAGVAITSGDNTITFSTDDILIDATADLNAGAGTNAIVTIQQANTTARTVTLGTNTGGTLGITDAELDTITADYVRIGRTDNTGNINVDITGGAITAAPADYETLALRTGGAVVDASLTTATDGAKAGVPAADITVNNLAMVAASGIGSGNDIDVAVTNLAATNSTANNIEVGGTGDLSVNDVAIGSGTTIQGVDNDAAGADVVITAIGHLQVQNSGATNDVNAQGDIDLAAEGPVTIKDTAEVESSNGGDIRILSGMLGGEADDVTLEPNSRVETTGSITISANPAAGTVAGELTSDGGGTGSGVHQGNAFVGNPNGGPATTITLSSYGDYTVTTELATNTISVTSATGNIIDDGDDTTYMQAPNITLTAALSIGNPTTTPSDGVTGVITPDEVIARGGDYLGAIDIDLQGGNLTLNQTGAGGHMQIREVDGNLQTSSIVFVPAAGAVGNNRQIALIAAGGVENLFPGPGLTSAGDFIWDGIHFGAAANPLSTSWVATNDNILFATQSGATSNALYIQSDLTTNLNNTFTAVATSPLYAIGDVTAGAITLTSTGDTATDGVFITGDYTSILSTITVNSQNDVVLFNTGSLNTFGNTIAVTADTNTNGSGDITLDGNVSSASGAVAFTAEGITQNQGSVNAGSGAVAFDANGSPTTLNGTVTTSNATAAALSITDTSAVDLGGTINVS
ncbi:MAG: hypothetical protein GW892_14935, partial [Armatimonadetes bacterium]|nr:hypothetical protein [Armatimonadota bacterium]